MSEQIEVEGTLNIYELAKVYHIKRPGIWRHNVSMEKTNKQTELIFIIFFRVIYSFYIVVQKFFFVK
jgi:hypothetical protein